MKTILKTTFLAGLFTLGIQLGSNAQQATTPIGGDLYGNKTNTPFTIYSGNNNYSGAFIKLHPENAGGNIIYHSGLNWSGTYLAHDFRTQAWQPATSTWLSTSRVVINQDGNVGIGTTSPYPGLHIANSASWGASLLLDARNASDGGGQMWAIQSGASSHDAGAGGFAIRYESTGLQPLTINPTGLVKMKEKVLVGLKSPSNHQDYKLGVEGKLVAQSIYVTNINDWADYVFADDYKLTPLSEVEAYVKVNKHLPEIPSTQEVMKNGIDVASMDALLLKKVEELTLHLIELQKQNEQLKNRVQTLEKK